jgi:hypothetical protein
MSAPIPLRQDFDASQLRGLARRSKDGPQARRLLALAAIDCDTGSPPSTRIGQKNKSYAARDKCGIGRIP